MGFGLGDITGGLFGGSEGSGGQVFDIQQGYLSDLYNRAQQASYGNMGQNFGQQFQQPAFNAFNQMAQGGAQIPGLQQGFQNFGQQSNEALGGAINAGLGQINDNFNQNIMPGINQGAAMTGTSGGSRQGIAQGLAAGQANRQATDFVNQMQSNNWQNQMQNQFQGLQGQAGLQGQQNQAMNAAMGQAPSLANLGFGNQYGNLAGLAGLIGSPAVLGGSTSQTGGLLPGLSNAFSFNYGTK